MQKGCLLVSTLISVVQAYLNLTDHAEFLTNLQGDTINNISAHNVNMAPNYGLLQLNHHIFSFNLHCNRYHLSG